MMYQGSTVRTPHPSAAPPQPDEPADWEAAATLACRTSIGSETLGADGKAAGVLTLVGIMFTVAARFGPEVGGVLRGGGLSRVACAALLFGFAGCALAAVVQAFRTISPRFREAQPSLAFFAEVARLEREEYVRRVESMTMPEAVEQILAYNHTAATICGEKYRQLRRCLRCFEAAAGSWLLLAVLLAAKSLHA
jgi:hypothetical protein